MMPSPSRIQTNGASPLPGNLSRRDLLRVSGGGLGAIALAAIEAKQAKASGTEGLHHAPKATRIIQIFLNGGLSQPDTFDYKPELEKNHGKPFQPNTGEKPEGVTSVPGNLMKSPFPFKAHGQCGRMVSSLFPNLATQVDRMAFLMAVASRSNVHGPASFLMNTGFLLPGFPSMGAWISYGLGQLAEDLPAFVVLPDSRGLPYNGKGNFSAGFLPANHNGVTMDAGVTPPIHGLSPDPRPKWLSTKTDVDARQTLQAINRIHASSRPGDDRLEARIGSYELAARMQLEAPGIMDLSREDLLTHRLYGTDRPEMADFAKRCLLARRLIERGSRFVQVWSGAGGPSKNWDNHTDILTELPYMTKQVDQPLTALLIDLDRRGLLEDTLVVCMTEFGRQPFTQGATGRDHNQGTTVAWLAGAGVKPGVAHGESDPWSWRAAQGKVTNYDIHATLLHLLGINHERLTYKHNGTNRRLTDVHGHVIKQVLG